MRVARKLALLALAVCSMTAFAASTAAAAAVRNEATGVACSAITENDAPATPEVAGGCPVRWVATDFEIGGAFGAMITCDITMEGKMNATGATNGVWAIDAATGGCESNTITPCAGAADAHAQTTALTGAASPYSMTYSLCWIGFGLTNRCTGLAGTVTEGAAHTYSMSFVHTSKCTNGVNSFQGTITQVIDAAHPKIEIT